MRIFYSTAELCPLGASRLSLSRRPLFYGLPFVFSTAQPIEEVILLRSPHFFQSLPAQDSRLFSEE